MGYCAEHNRLRVRYGTSVARAAYLGGYESELRRSGLGVFDTVYVLAPLALQGIIQITLFGVTRWMRNGARLREHEMVFGPCDVLLYAQTNKALQVEAALKEAFERHANPLSQRKDGQHGYSQEIVAVQPEVVASRARELLGSNSTGWAANPSGIFLWQGKGCYSNQGSLVQVASLDYAKQFTSLKEALVV